MSHRQGGCPTLAPEVNEAPVIASQGAPGRVGRRKPPASRRHVPSAHVAEVPAPFSERLSLCYCYHCERRIMTLFLRDCHSPCSLQKASPTRSQGKRGGSPPGAPGEREQLPAQDVPRAPI